MMNHRKGTKLSFVFIVLTIIVLMGAAIFFIHMQPKITYFVKNKTITNEEKDAIVKAFNIDDSLNSNYITNLTMVHAQQNGAFGETKTNTSVTFQIKNNDGNLYTRTYYTELPEGITAWIYQNGISNIFIEDMLVLIIGTAIMVILIIVQTRRINLQ